MTEPDQSQISNFEYLTREKERNAGDKILNELRSEFREIQNRNHGNMNVGISNKNLD